MHANAAYACVQYSIIVVEKVLKIKFRLQIFCVLDKPEAVTKNVMIDLSAQLEPAI